MELIVTSIDFENNGWIPDYCAGYGKHCYRGPKPPFNRKHRYKFMVYALDTNLQMETFSKKSDLVNAIEGHVLAKGELIGKYQRRHT